VELAGLFIYPVKSLRGLSVGSAAVDELGLVGDRRFLVVNAAGLFLTQRALPRMALIATALTDDWLVLRADGAGELRVARAPDPAAPLRTVGVWKDADLQAEDCGEEAAGWLGAFLGVKCRLVRIGPAFARSIPPRKLSGLAAPRFVSFADSHPFLAIGEATLADLNDRLAAQGEPALPMDRFRPNLVIRGGAPYAEDGWDRLRVDGVAFRGAELCARCIITATDQATAERGTEPLRTLAAYRRDAQEPSKVNFGRNFVHEAATGVLRTGAAVEVP
jgi:uncharacterized protein YcbX